MNRTAISIAIIIPAITLVGMAAIAVNYSPAPAHAQTCKGFIFPQTHGTECFPSKKACEDALVAAGGGGKCINSHHR
jgi:hypothetical protein